MSTDANVVSRSSRVEFVREDDDGRRDRKRNLSKRSSDGALEGRHQDSLGLERPISISITILTGSKYLPMRQIWFLTYLTKMV